MPAFICEEWICYKAADESAFEKPKLVPECFKEIGFGSVGCVDVKRYVDCGDDESEGYRREHQLPEFLLCSGQEAAFKSHGIYHPRKHHEQRHVEGIDISQCGIAGPGGIFVHPTAQQGVSPDDKEACEEFKQVEPDDPR